MVRFTYWKWVSCSIEINVDGFFVYLLWEYRVIMYNSIITMQLRIFPWFFVHEIVKICMDLAFIMCFSFYDQTARPKSVRFMLCISANYNFYLHFLDWGRYFTKRRAWRNFRKPPGSFQIVVHLGPASGRYVFRSMHGPFYCMPFTENRKLLYNSLHSILD